MSSSKLRHIIFINTTTSLALGLETSALKKLKREGKETTTNSEVENTLKYYIKVKALNTIIFQFICKYIVVTYNICVIFDLCFVPNAVKCYLFVD